MAVILPYEGTDPVIGEEVFVAPNATVIGKTKIGKDCSIWFGAVIRGDVQTIDIGVGTNVQDNAVVHVTTGTGPTVIGDNVTIGHGAIVHACTIKDNVLIGMGAVILDGAVIGEETLVGAGAVVTPRTKIPPRSLVVGSPAKVLRGLATKEIESIKNNGRRYVTLAKKYLSADLDARKV